MLNFLNIADEYSGQDTSAVHIIPVPYDQTSTYRKGADRGPQAIINASAQVEWFDIQTATEPHLQGIHTQPPIVCQHPDPVHLASIVEQRVAQVLTNGKLPVVLGGEHSVSIGAIQAACKHAQRSANQITIVQLDAHSDTRESYQGSTHNHACVMARARELAPILQVGIRSLDKSEREPMDLDRVYFAHDILNSSDLGWMDRVVDQCAADVYLTIDLDVFDPSVIPATGTPEPGGLDWMTINTLIHTIARKRNIIAFDVVELCPHEAHHASDFSAAKLVFRTIAEIHTASTIKATKA
ncbi:MAG: agmatinase [Phycisphaerales bacterium]